MWASWFHVGTYIMYLWMIYKMMVDPKDLIYLHQGLAKKDIDTEIARFHVSTESATSVEEQETARYIVATSSCIHVGHTFAEALVLGLLEPDFRRHTMLQLFCRHHRQGNKNPMVYTFLFVASVSPVEDRIQQVNAWRASIDQSAQRKAREIIGTTKEHGIDIDDTSYTGVGDRDELVEDDPTLYEA